MPLKFVDLIILKEPLYLEKDESLFKKLKEHPY